jgi:hypothetical protein
MPFYGSENMTETDYFGTTGSQKCHLGGDKKDKNGISDQNLNLMYHNFNENLKL